GIGETQLTFHLDAEQSTESGGPSSLDLGETISFAQSFVEPITILVADIRGFTKMSEKLPINSLSSIMAAWFQRIQEQVEMQGGRVDKFIGDCVMAIWDNEEDAEWTILWAISTSDAINRI